MTNDLAYIPASVRARKSLDIRVGDVVRVQVKIQEKGKTRLQAFEGLVIARKHGTEPGGTITVRKVSHGVGVERVFPLYSLGIDSIEVVRRSVVRRSKLYYIRTKVAREIRRKMRNFVAFIQPSLADAILPEEPVVEDTVMESAPQEQSVETPETETSKEETQQEEGSDEDVAKESTEEKSE